MARLGGLCWRPAPAPSLQQEASSSLRLCKASAWNGSAVSPPGTLSKLSASTEKQRSVEGKQLSQSEDLEFYEPTIGDVVIGAVVSGNTGKLDIDIGARKLAMMFNSNANPFEKFSLRHQMLDVASTDVVPSRGTAFYVQDVEILEENKSGLVLEPGTIVHALVIGVGLSGAAVLSARSVARRLVWQRIREIYKAAEAIQVRIEAFNRGGLICRVEGLTAFLPRERIQNSPRGLSGLRDYVGKSLLVLITELDDAKNRILVSERAAWVQKLAPPNTLVQGVVTKVEPFGVIVEIAGISALLHVSSISHKRIPDLGRIFSEGDRLKAIVTAPRELDKVVLNTAFLEREKGLMITDKERVFNEAEEAFEQWKIQKERFVHDVRKSKEPFVDLVMDETKQAANYEWLSFEE